MEDPTIRADVLQALSLVAPDGLSAADLGEQLGHRHPRASINGCLYRMEGDSVRKTVGGPRPIWRLATPAPPDGPPTIVLVDLGNVHDCLAPCERYVADGLVRATYAFADYHFNGYGVNPRPAGITVEQVTDPNKNAADVLMIWRVAEMILGGNVEPGTRFVAATKDDGFRYLKTLVEQAGFAFEFVRDASQLRNLLE